MGATLTGLSAILQNQPSGRWIAVADDRVIADADSPAAAAKEAEEKGETNPILVRIPDNRKPQPASLQEEIPYGAISVKLEAGLVVPFLGAGASLIRPKNAEWNETAPFLPSAGELSRYLATLGGLPRSLQRDPDLAKICSYYSSIADDRTGLLLALRRALGPICPDGSPREIETGTIHKYLAKLREPRLIITTNYDNLLEKAFKDEDRPYDLLVYPADRRDDDSGARAMWKEHGSHRKQYLPPDELPIDFENSERPIRPIIYKMHGSIGDEQKEDHFVISEEDYLRFLSRVGNDAAIPSVVLAYLQTRSMLFLGYSLRDWNLRLVLYNLNGVVRDLSHRLRKDERRPALRRNEEGEVIRSWAIQRRPSEVDRNLWEARGVKIYDEDIQEFAEKMKTLQMRTTWA